MRIQFAFQLLLTLATIPYSASQTPRPGHESDNHVLAGNAYSTQLKRELAELRDAALADDYAYQQLAHLTDNVGPRPSGSPQAAAAVQYVADELRKLGLEVRLEEVKVPQWIRGAETAELVEYAGQARETKQKIVLTALSGNTPTPTDGILGEVVVVRSFDELNALGRQKVAGKIVLFNVVFDKQKAANGMAGEAYGEAWPVAQEEQRPPRIWGLLRPWCDQSGMQITASHIPDGAHTLGFQPALSRLKTPI